MRFFSISTLLTASAVVFTGISATPSPAAALGNALDARAADATSALGLSLTKDNFYGAPTPPWKKGAKPGWYYGKNHDLLDELNFLLPWLGDKFICWLLSLFPGCLHCPKPPHGDGWHQTFSNLTAAVQADDYMTFGLVDTVDDCKAMCESVDGCTFFNSYHDVNGKDGSPLLTCSLFSKCHTADDADNAGGQSQPDGSIDYITNSDGFCYTGK